MSEPEESRPRIDVLDAGLRDYARLSMPPRVYEPGELEPYIRELCARASGDDRLAILGEVRPSPMVDEAVMERYEREAAEYERRKDTPVPR